MNNKLNSHNTRSRPGTKSLSRYSIGHYVLIVVTLIFLGANALPNMYPKQQWLQVTQSVSEKNEAEKVDAISLGNTHSLRQQLLEQGFQIEAINQDTPLATTYIRLQDESQYPDLKQFLHANKLPKDGLKLIEQSSSPAWLKQLGAEPIKLGLDLSGGVLFVLDVDIEQAIAERMDSIVQSIKLLQRENRLRGLKITQPEPTQILVQYLPSQDLSHIRSQIPQQFPGLSLLPAGNNQLVIYYSDTDIQQIRSSIMEQSLATMRGRIEELGITEAVVQIQGNDRIRIELPGVSNPDEARDIIGATASLDFYEAQNTAGKVFKTDSGENVRVKSRPIFTGNHIQNAQAGRDEMGIPLVNLTLDAAGGDKMFRFSSENVGEPIITVYSEYYKNAAGETVKSSEVINVATIQMALGSRFSITNMSSPQQAQELALLLRAGSLDAPVTITKEQTINATLGKTNIDNGLAALVLGIALTLAFMVIWYRRLGIIANCALLLNLVCLLGLMSLLPGAVLTLPGIAGLVLTVGMAVDTNVLIFERIREELKRGRSPLTAVDLGYKNALTTILDSNITTLLCALILFSIGYGPVKGFAITLGLGILTSMFTGLYVSKGLTQLFYRGFRKRPQHQTTKQGANS